MQRISRLPPRAISGYSATLGALSFMGVEMTISATIATATVQNRPPQQSQPQAAKERPLLGPALPNSSAAQARPVPTEIQPTQPVALPPVVTALTADLAAGRAAAEAARAAYHEQQRISGS